MASASKILTVSYGTFSCTLEGFDDPFTMMKAIAEYFRDLAADDRYFGAEPPQPDVAMLHQIAETAAQTRVETQIAKNEIKLTQTDGAGRRAQPVADLNHDAGEPIATAAQALDHDIAASETVPFPKDSMAETVAQKLARIRAAATHDEEPYTEDEHADAFFGRSTSAGTKPFADAPEDTTDEVSKDVTRPAAAGRVMDKSLFDPAARERLMIEQDKAGQDATDPEEDDRAERLSGIETSMEEARSGRQKAEEPPGNEDLPVDDSVETGGADEKAGAAYVGAIPHGGRSDDPAQAENTAEDHIAGEEQAETRSVVRPERIRVLRVKRKSTDAVPVSSARLSVEDGIEETGTGIGEGEPDPKGPLSVTEEAELAEIDAEAASTRDGRARLAAANTSDDALDRIMATTNDRLGDLNARRRHSTLSHLKAAVTATRAEPSIAAAGYKDPDAAAAYREDLDQVVSKSGDKRHPPLILVSEQRVDADGRALQTLRHQTAPWAEPASAVSGLTEKADAAVSAARHAGSFADYAENLGAVDLQDLLEAAAVYTAQIEGQPHFSRPTIMGHVHSAMNRNFSKEDSLRSFGILLRNGTIKKVRRGQFTVSEDSKFLPEEARIVHR